ncbi:MAG: hypothetical protein AABW41_04340 [Nanoarchaeota archaeon]
MTFESRKIIKFGNSSHVVSLPSSWVKKNKLNKGDKVFLKESLNNELVIFTNSEQGKEIIKEITIDATNKPFLYIDNALISAYINDYNIIKIIGKNLDKTANDIRKIIHELAGLEVIEQNNDRIIAKDFLNVKDISLDTIIRRSDIILRNMLLSLKDCAKNGSGDCSITVSNSDMDVNRLCFVLNKVSRKAFDNPQFAKDLNMSAYSIINYYRFMFNLENFGDEIKRVARLFTIAKKSKKNNIKSFVVHYETIESMYLDTMKAFYSKDSELAYRIYGDVKDVIINVNEMLEHNVYPVDVRIVEKLKNMLICIKRMVRITINLSIG